MNDELQAPALRRQTLVLSALRHVLRPLVRLLLLHGINYTMLLEELKRVFVRVADEEFRLDGKPQTDSRLTLLTGVHRKDVHRIRDENAVPPEEFVRASLGAQLISIWVANPDYLDETGQPMPLPRLARAGGERSFEALVASISKDFRARPVLDEWLRLGIAHVDDADRVCLNTEAFVPRQGLEEKLFFFRMNIHDHLAAAVNNLDESRAALLERCVYYDGLTPENVAHLHQYATQQGMNALKAVNRRALQLQQAQTAQSEGESALQRMNFGVYFHQAPSDAPTRGESV